MAAGDSAHGLKGAESAAAPGIATAAVVTALAPDALTSDAGAPGSPNARYPSWSGKPRDRGNLTSSVAPTPSSPVARMSPPCRCTI
ncbi:MAG: hypothetical protein RIF41_19205, partial [Polyangiaceae bacterium]